MTNKLKEILLLMLVQIEQLDIHIEDDCDHMYCTGLHSEDLTRIRELISELDK